MGFGGPGHEFAGPAGQMPSVEQMQAMGMTAEQIQMATSYGPEMVGHGPMGPMEFGHTPMMGFEGPGPMGGYMPEGWAQNQTGEFHYVDTWSNTTDLRTDLQSTTTTAAQEVHENAIHMHGEVQHTHDIHIHSDGKRHDHTATSPADVAPNSTF